MLETGIQATAFLVPNPREFESLSWLVFTFTNVEFHLFCRLSDACSVAMNYWCWLNPCSFCVCSFDYLEDYVGANIVGSVKSVLQQCVGGQVVQDLFAMLVDSCGQTRWVFPVVIFIDIDVTCAIIHNIFFCLSFGRKNELAKSIFARVDRNHPLYLLIVLVTLYCCLIISIHKTNGSDKHHTHYFLVGKDYFVLFLFGVAHSIFFFILTWRELWEILQKQERPLLLIKMSRYIFQAVLSVF